MEGYMQRQGARDASGNRPPMSGRRRVALSAHAGEIEAWVGEGRSDQWIASALGTSPASVQSFRSRKRILRILRKGRGEPPEREPEEPGRNTVSLYEGTLEHGEEGHGLWFDPAVADDPLFRRGFGQVIDVEVSVREAAIVITPAPGRRQEAPEAGAKSAGDGASQPETAFGSQARSTLAGSNREWGSVRWFEPAKGYGFIFRPDGREIFFHKSGIEGALSPVAGAEVSYEVGENERGPIAVEVRSG